MNDYCRFLYSLFTMIFQVLEVMNCAIKRALLFTMHISKPFFDLNSILIFIQYELIEICFQYLLPAVAISSANNKIYK